MVVPLVLREWFPSNENSPPQRQLPLWIVYSTDLENSRSRFGVLFDERQCGPFEEWRVVECAECAATIEWDRGA